MQYNKSVYTDIQNKLYGLIIDEFELIQYANRFENFP